MTKSSRGKSADYSDIADSFRQHGDGISEALGSLRRTAEVSGSDEDYVRKVKDLEERFSAIRDEASILLSSMLPSAPAGTKDEQVLGPPVVIRCKQWEDFKVQAYGAITVSFLCKPEERAFQVDALKGGNVYTFSGQLPSDTALLANWLSRELSVAQRRVLEGVLALG
jgi:hypothetical protein